jgi:hypothetical protein
MRYYSFCQQKQNFIYPFSISANQRQSAQVLVPPNPERPLLPAHPAAASHPSGPEVRQHFHHRHDWKRQNWRPG